jgi:hypothetical protein
MSTHEGDALHEVARVLLTTSPAIRTKAVNAEWTDGDRWVDFERLVNEWNDRSAPWSSGERQLIGAVAALVSCSTSGLDPEDARALVGALEAGLAVAVHRLAAAEEGAALLARLFGHERAHGVQQTESTTRFTCTQGHEGTAD